MRPFSLLLLGLALGVSGHAAEPFVASTAHSFRQLMSESMTRMHSGMSAAPQDGGPDHDFVTR